MLLEVGSLGDFLRRIAFDYARYGYTRYALRQIPADKDFQAIDLKLHRVYGVTSCRTRRSRQRRRGLACVEYLRFQEWFILLATPGHHEAFSKIRSFDLRQSPLHFRGYSVGFVGERVSIRVARSVWRRVQRKVYQGALQDGAEVEKWLASLPFYRFPDVVTQLESLTLAINLRRKRAGLSRVTPRFQGGDASLYRSSQSQFSL